MDSKEYVAATGYDRKIMLPDINNPASTWALGAEVVLLSAMDGSHDALSALAASQRAYGQKIHEIIMAKRAMIAPLGSITEKEISEHREGSEKIHNLVDNSKSIIASRQIIALSSFFSNHLVSGRGDSIQSFNQRVLKSVVLPTLKPFTVEMRRTRQGSSYSFESGNYKLEEDLASKDSKTPLALLHSSLLEYDVLVALFHMVIERKLPFTPILAGPISEQLNYRPSQSMNADILLIKDDAQEVIPIQVKVRARPIERSKYDESIVMVDSNTIGTWSSKPKTTIDEAGRAHSEPEITYIAGKVSRQACMAHANGKKNGKTLAKITGNPHITDSLFKVIELNQFHNISSRN